MRSRQRAQEGKKAMMDRWWPKKKGTRIKKVRNGVSEKKKGIPTLRTDSSQMTRIKGKKEKTLGNRGGSFQGAFRRGGGHGHESLKTKAKNRAWSGEWRNRAWGKKKKKKKTAFPDSLAWHNETL